MDSEGLITSLFRWFYHRARRLPLDTRRPRFQWMPKYGFEVRLPAEILDAADPTDALEVALAQHGFELEHWTRTQAVYARGSRWGDFSIKYVRMRVRVDTPMTNPARFCVEAADIALFDTGDVWQLSVDLKAHLESLA